MKKSYEIRSFLILLIFDFQTRNLGARIDLRTIMHALLDPTSSRLILRDSQEARILYFNLRLSFTFILCYYKIKRILTETLHRQIQDGEYEFEHVDPDDFIAIRKLKMKKRKLTLGRVIKEGFQVSFDIDRLHQEISYILCFENPMVTLSKMKCLKCK